MKKQTKLLSAILALSLFLALTACSAGTTTPTPPVGTPPGQSSETSGEPTNAPVELLIGASHVSGNMYQWCVATADIVNKYSNWVSIVPITTQGTTETIQLMEVDECQLGGCTGTATVAAYLGEGEWNGQTNEQLRIVTDTHASYWQIMVPADSPCNSLADLAGRRVSLNTKSSGAYTTNVQLLNNLGIDPDTYFNSFYMSMAESISAIQEGSLDCFLYTGTIGSSAAMELANSRAGLKLISLTDEEVAVIEANNPTNRGLIFPAGSYETIDYDVQTVGGPVTMTANEAVPDDAIYEIVKILNEHYDELVSSLAIAEFTTPENTVADWGDVNAHIVPIHDGAIRYYQELGLMP